MHFQMGKRQNRCHIQKYLSKEKAREWFMAYHAKDSCCEPAIVCAHCEKVVDENEPCEDCYFFCCRCCYFFLVMYEKCGYDGSGLKICGYCMEVDKAMEEEESPPEIKQPE